MGPDSIAAPSGSGFGLRWREFLLMAPSFARNQGLWQRDETNSEMLQFLQRSPRICYRTAPAIQSPHQYQVDLAPTCSFQRSLSRFLVLSLRSSPRAPAWQSSSRAGRHIPAGRGSKSSESAGVVRCATFSPVCVPGQNVLVWLRNERFSADIGTGCTPAWWKHFGKAGQTMTQLVISRDCA
jgi:hypothetical protein